MKTSNPFIARQCDQAGAVMELHEYIASGQVSAAQIEAPRAAGDFAQPEQIAAVPKPPHHPEPHTFTWSRLELESITAYGKQCFETGRSQPKQPADGLLINEDTKAQPALWDALQAATAAERERCELLYKREAEIQKAAAKFCGVENLDTRNFDICAAAIRQGGDT